MKHKLYAAIAAICLGVAGLVGITASPAVAADCIIPGNWHLITNPVNGHHACYRVFNQPVPGNPGWCFTTYYLQELVDTPNDNTAVSLRTNDSGAGWVTRLTTNQSAAWVVKSGYHAWAVPYWATCSDFGNPTSAQARFTHAGARDWTYVTVDWVN